MQGFGDGSRLKSLHRLGCDLPAKRHTAYSSIGPRIRKYWYINNKNITLNLFWGGRQEKRIKKSWSAAASSTLNPIEQPMPKGSQRSCHARFQALLISLIDVSFRWGHPVSREVRGARAGAWDHGDGGSGVTGIDDKNSWEQKTPYH